MAKYVVAHMDRDASVECRVCGADAREITGDEFWAMTVQPGKLHLVVDDFVYVGPRTRCWWCPGCHHGGPVRESVGN